MLSLSLLIAAAASTVAAPEPGVFEVYLENPIPPADGFDPPGGGRTARAIGAGRVISIRRGTVEIEHRFYENHEKRRVVVTHHGVEPAAGLEEGAVVSRGQPIGAARAASVSILEGGRAHEHGPFIAARRSLPVPPSEPRVVLVDHESYRLAIAERGRIVSSFEIALGQAAGQKRVRGDLKTPKGMYFVISKQKGRFDGPYGAYYGGHWIKINYPNPWDAEWGAPRGLVRAEDAAKIRRAWIDRAATPGGTRLGGGIGFHGWADEWEAQDGLHLSWGCVVAHLRDIGSIYDRVEVGTMVVIF